MRHNENGLFPALEAALKAATEPVDCQTLYDMPSIREHAASVNRVSDYLGGLWRKGLVLRTTTERSANSRARFAYEWKGGKGPTMHSIEYAPRVLADRPTLLITEEGGVINIELPNLLISIRQKLNK